MQSLFVENGRPASFPNCRGVHSFICRSSVAASDSSRSSLAGKSLELAESLRQCSSNCRYHFRRTLAVLPSARRDHTRRCVTAGSICFRLSAFSMASMRCPAAKRKDAHSPSGRLETFWRPRSVRMRAELGHDSKSPQSLRGTAAPSQTGTGAATYASGNDG